MAVAFVFPGQGSQYPLMGKKAVEKCPTGWEFFNLANEILGYSLWEVINEEGEKLNLTTYTQPAIYVINAIAYQTLSDWGISPSYVAGHSLGEFSALQSAGVISFVEGLKLVQTRGKLMQEACPLGEGGMAAVIGLEPKIIEEICQRISQEGECLVAANLNAPLQVVISGHISAIQKAIPLLKSAGARQIINLPVSAPFHSPLMQEANLKFNKILDNIVFNKPRFPVIMNTSGLPETEPEKIKKNIAFQMLLPVQWEKCIKNMASFGVKTFIEVGPNNILCGLIKRIDRGLITIPFDEVNTFEDLLKLLNS